MEHHHLATDDTVEVACSLDAGRLDGRVAAWRQVTARAISLHAEPGRVTSVYPRDADLVEQLTWLIDAEADCCPFLRFTVHQRTDDVQVVLEYPEGFEGLLGSVLGAPRPA